MVIDKSLMGTIFAADVGGEEISAALNAIQKAYDEYMKVGWEKLEKEGEPGGQDVAARGFSFLVASGAFHFLLLHGSPKEMMEMVKEAVRETLEQMVAQLHEKHREQNPEAKA